MRQCLENCDRILGLNPSHSKPPYSATTTRTSVGDFCRQTVELESTRTKYAPCAHLYQVCSLVSTRTKYVPLCAQFHRGLKNWVQNSEQDRFLYGKDNPHQNSSLVLLSKF